MIRALRIDHVVFRVTDVERTIAFWSDLLGCEVEKVQEELGLWQLRAGDALIDLVTVDGPLGLKGGAAPGAGGRNVDHVCLRVEPWDEAAIRARLAAMGVAVLESGRRYGAEGHGPSLYVADPDGNTLELKGPADAP